MEEGQGADAEQDVRGLGRGDAGIGEGEDAAEEERVAEAQVRGRQAVLADEAVAGDQVPCQVPVAEIVALERRGDEDDGGDAQHRPDKENAEEERHLPHATCLACTRHQPAPEMRPAPTGRRRQCHSAAAASNPKSDSVAAIDRMPSDSL